MSLHPTDGDDWSRNWWTDDNEKQAVKDQQQSTVIHDDPWSQARKHVQSREKLEDFYLFPVQQKKYK